MKTPGKLISNEYRTSSLSIPSVELEAVGGQSALGYRLVNGRSCPTGFETGGFENDPLEILMSLEEPYGTVTDDDLEMLRIP
jgi:hypothetical protein